MSGQEDEEEVRSLLPLLSICGPISCLSVCLSAHFLVLHPETLDFEHQT